MGFPLRRISRLGTLTILLALPAGALVGQFWPWKLYTPVGAIYVGPAGVALADLRAAWHVWSEALPPAERWTHLLAAPRWVAMSRVRVVLLPWWLLLATWLPLTRLVWFLTRGEGGRGAFPIELAANGE